MVDASTWDVPQSAAAEPQVKETKRVRFSDLPEYGKNQLLTNLPSEPEPPKEEASVSELEMSPEEVAKK